MNRSFYYGKLADIYEGTKNFTALIVASPASYGLTSAQATAYQTLNNSFVAAYDLAQAPQTRTKGAILARNDAKFLLQRKAAELSKIIEATPTVTNEQKADLGLAVRGIPGPKPAPGMPSSFKVMLQADGSVQVSFKANNPKGLTGVVYQIWRRVGPSGPYSYLCGAGEKRFIDSTIPAGTAQVTYQIQGVRSTAAGPWAQINVNFGTAGMGQSSVSVTETAVDQQRAA